MKKKGIIIGIIAVIGIIIAVLAVRGNIPPENGQQSNQAFSPIVFTGSSDMTTPPFKTTTQEWIIDWSYIPDPEYNGVFAFYVYPRGETIIFIEAIIADGDTFGTTYSYAGKGEYYIKVICLFIQNWEITIKPPI